MSGYLLDSAKANKLIAAAEPDERAILAFLCLNMFQQDNCGEYIYQEDIENAKTIFESEIVDRVIEKWFFQPACAKQSFSCIVKISTDNNEE